MINFYWKASIISNLSASVPAIPFRSSIEFLHSPYQITLIKDSSYQEFFEKSKIEPFKTAWDTKFVDKTKSLKKSLKEMVPLIETGEYAMFEVLSSTRTLQEYKECKITDSGFFVNKMSFAFTLQKNSQFTQLFNYGMRKMIEHGNLKRILVKNQPGRPSCNDKKKGISLGLSNIAFAFFVLLVGAVCGLLLFLLEKISNPVLRLTFILLILVSGSYLYERFYLIF